MLESVVFPDSVLEVAGCFWENKYLTTVVFGENTRKLGYEVFGSCKLVQTLVIPESVTYIDEGIFSRYYGDILCITVYTTKGSYADKWAQSLGLMVSYEPYEIS